MQVFWYSLRFNNHPENECERSSSEIPQVSHGAIDASLNITGGYLLRDSICGIRELGGADFGVPIKSDGYLVFFSDICDSEAYRLLVDYISAKIASWNHALIALENTLTFERIDFHVPIPHDASREDDQFQEAAKDAIREGLMSEAMATDVIIKSIEMHIEEVGQ